MMRSEYLLYVVTAVIAVFIGGCSLVVDFDRALLVDGGVDAGADAAVDAGPDAAVEAGVEAR
jgi:hypothetical protein